MVQVTDKLYEHVVSVFCVLWQAELEEEDFLGFRRGLCGWGCGCGGGCWGYFARGLINRTLTTPQIILIKKTGRKV